MDIKEHVNNLMLKYDSMILDTPEFIKFKQDWSGSFAVYKTPLYNLYFHIHTVYYYNFVCFFCDVFSNKFDENVIDGYLDSWFHKYDTYIFFGECLQDGYIEDLYKISKDEYMSKLNDNLNNIKKIIYKEK